MSHLPPCRPTLFRRATALAFVAVAVALGTAVPHPVAGQGVGPGAAPAWDSPQARALAERATARRAEQIADTLLGDYTATAHGFLTFLAQVGEGFPDPPRVVKADQLAVRVYWKAPDMSKQLLVGRRDTLLLPADVGYYRDRYGIIQNNFPDRIRLGDGNDVRDVPHPLSALGLAEYQFALGDSLRIRLPGRTIEVDEVRFRPLDPTQPRAVGTLYIDRETGAVARMALTFTAAAILDRRIETLAVTLENGLVEGRFWLPHRQELEVARTSTWLDFPARGIIRGRWEVTDYQVNRGLSPAIFGGAEIVAASPQALRDYPFEGPLLAQLPSDVQAVTEADVQRVRQQAQQLVRQQMLARATGTAFSAHRVSDLLRVNRVEGLAFGAGGLWRPMAGWGLSARARYGIADEQVKGRVSLLRTGPIGSRGPIELFAERAYRMAGDVQETSLVRNSLAAQEFGSDYTDPVDVRAAGIGAELGEHWDVRWRTEGSWLSQRPLVVNATPATNRYEPTIPVTAVDGAQLLLAGERLAGGGPFGTQLRWGTELRAGLYDDDRRMLRLTISADAERPLGDGRLILATVASGLTGTPLPQSLVYFGGPVSAPGYDFHTLVGRAGLSQRVEWRTPLPFPAVPLGRFGTTPATMTLAPYAHVTAIADPIALPGRPDRAGGVYPSVGVAGVFLFDLLRVDVARGLRDGRWWFGVDVSRTLWGIL